NSFEKSLYRELNPILSINLFSAEGDVLRSNSLDRYVPSNHAAVFFIGNGLTTLAIAKLRIMPGSVFDYNIIV
ncbi:MAG: hypothetical protein ACP5RS_07090, partial [Thermoplasmata archaeon]